MPRLRTMTLLLALTGWATLPPALDGQVVNGTSIKGDWVRIDSNNDPNDLMRMHIDVDGTLTSVPATAASFRAGQVLWMSIQSNGSVRIRGSDGQYYDATLAMNGPDEIRVDIAITAPGDDQTWRRAGPDINGDWVQVAPVGAPNDGLKLTVQSFQASVGYLPASSPRSLRVGSRLWQNIGGSGTLEVLGTDRNYHAATYTLIDSNTLRIDATGIAGGAGQIWVRPSAVRSARTTLANGGTLAPPPANPNQPGAGLQAPGNLPGVPATPTTPPIPPGSPPACLATSLPDDRLGLTWGLGMYSPSNDDARAETVGIREFTVSGLPSPWVGNTVPSDIERSRFPGLQPGFAWVWEGGGSRRVFPDQTAQQLDQRIQAARPAGERPVDIEAGASSGATRYSTVWGSNTEGVDWRVEYDMTLSQYDSRVRSRRSAGYRLVDLEPYQTSAGVRYAGIWWASCDDTNWKQVADMDRQAYQARVNAEARQGYQVVDFESYQTSAGQRYAAIWERIPAGRGWMVRTDRTLNWFLNYHQEYVDQGMRLVDYEAYDTPNGPRYAGIWAENDPRYDYALRPAIDDTLEAYRARHGIPGISVVVMQDDRVIYRRGVGWADSAQQRQAHSGTIYITASIAKAIGGTIAARLEEKGVIDLTAPTRSILTNMPAWHTHTVEQLLSKTGCVVHYPEISNKARPDTTVVYAWQLDAAAVIWKDPLLPNCTPGSQYRYSTHGFTLVGAALEEATGKPIWDILRDELTTPFNLPSMGRMVSGRWGGFDPPGVRPYDLARGYERHPTKWGWRVEANYENASWKALGGGIETNALDLARFGWLTLDGQIVSPTTRDTRLWRTQTNGVVNWSDGARAPSVGLAWDLDGRGPRLYTGSGSRLRRVAEHRGNARGVTSILRIYRDEGVTIAILSNLAEDLATRTGVHPVSSLATKIARIVFRNPPPP